MGPAPTLFPAYYQENLTQLHFYQYGHESNQPGQAQNNKRNRKNSVESNSGQVTSILSGLQAKKPSLYSRARGAGRLGLMVRRFFM